ncbi:hypothetical protein [Methylosinus sp. Sm6]|uniref:hypothetical protein n=1 Tax=Methylosinus sp. Sm6 TaxID=2866948 RepID=UPI001C990020|nr:hypothetical protein [Methylosinus sp. Sm6]MBY6244077.1 hypothetical protein [Methylosinus sp. Sm6]
MTTIAQDYAAELRRISRYLSQIGHFADSDELRLAAEYLERSAKGVAIDGDAIEERFDPAQMAELAAFAQVVVARQTALFETFFDQLKTQPERLRNFFDFVCAFYLQQAAVFAVSGVRPGERMLSQQDFAATARDAWMQSVLADAGAQMRVTGAQS